jgi:Flp pilus assembly protein TadD
MNGEHDKAIEVYTKAIELDPNDAEAYNNRGLEYHNKGQYDSAIGDYTKAIELDPNYFYAYNNRGNAYANKGQYDSAIEDYNKAIALNPNYASVYNNRGTAYSDNGQYDSAIEDFNKAIVLNPNYASAYNNRGIVYDKKSQYDKAIENYNKAIELDPNDTEAYYNRGITYIKKIQYDRAISDFQKACDMGNEEACDMLKKVKIKTEEPKIHTEQKPKRVEELEHFPFKSFDEFKKRVIEGIANIRVDRGAALQWAQNGIYSSAWLRKQCLFLSLLPFIAGIGFIMYAIVTKSWLLLLALPVLLIGFFIFHPSSAPIFGFIRSGVIGLTLIGLAWGFLNGIGWLAALSLSLTVIWYAQRTIYRKAINGIIRSAFEHEDLLCILWNINVLSIAMYNGDNYWVKWKTEGGKSTHYDSGNTYDN